MPSVIETIHPDDETADIQYFYPGRHEVPYDSFNLRKATQLIVVACDLEDRYTTVLFCAIPREILTAQAGTAFPSARLPIISRHEIGPGALDEMRIDAPSLGIAPRQLVLSHCVSMKPN
jgi:hypothetical protein